MDAESPLPGFTESGVAVLTSQLDGSGLRQNRPMELELDSHRSLLRLTPPDAFVLAVGPLVMELRAQGLSYERLATELASRDVPTLKGRT